MKRILITGSNGLLGQKLSDLYLQMEDRQILATGAGPSRYKDASGLNYCTMDITDSTETEKVIADFKPDCVINTAAMTNVDACEFEKEKCDALNIIAVKNLAELSNKYNFHLVHISTDFIFEGTHPMYTEDEEAIPLSYYGNSKLMGEKMVIETAKSYAILRTVLVYGVVHDMSRSNIVLWAINALKNKKNIKVVNDQFRTPTLAEDLALGCYLAESKSAQGIYNIAGKDYLRIDELVLRVSKYFNYPVQTMELVSSDTLNQPAKRPPITGLNIEKAKNDLGYAPRSFEEGLEIVANQLKGME